MNDNKKEVAPEVPAQEQLKQVSQDVLEQIHQGKITINQARSIFDLQPIEGGDKKFTTAQYYKNQNPID